LERLQIRFLGTGDAFGHGGRLQPCILIESPDCRFLLDCGASAMISMERFGVNPNGVDMILLSHLHGDHFGGVPFFILDAQLHSKREAPLRIVGPTGSGRRIDLAMEVLFPGSSKIQRKFRVEKTELDPGKSWPFRDIVIEPILVNHASGDPALAFRIEACGKSIGYTGDTEWTKTLTSLRHVDLLIAEAYFFEKLIKYHLSFQTLAGQLKALRPKRTLITHMSRDMLSRLGTIEVEAAEDGMTVEV
jgi:ribonuclease BN (tRNA processing enzyme)